MRIITHSCPACGTVVAANELESNRVMKCPGLGCQEALRFEDLPFGVGRVRCLDISRLRRVDLLGRALRQLRHRLDAQLVGPDRP